MDDREIRRKYGEPTREGTAPGERGPAAPPDWQLWLSFTGSFVLWLLHFLAYYLAVERICAGGGDGDASRWLLVLATALVAAAAAALSVFSWRLGRRAEGNLLQYDDFLPRVGVYAGMVTVFVLALEGLALFYVPVCS